jgi:hypothetical protein
LSSHPTFRDVPSQDCISCHFVNPACLYACSLSCGLSACLYSIS